MSEQQRLITGPGGTSSVKKGKVDLVFVVDTTGSMNDKIEALIQTCIEFANETENYNLVVSFSLISFGDIQVLGGGDKILVEVSLTDSVPTIRSKLRSINKNQGFGNIGESSFEAVVEATKLQYRPDAVKVIILITDEPAHQTKYKASQIIGMLKEGNFLVYTVATPDSYYKTMAKENGGEWVEISANSNLNEVKKLFERLAQKVAEMSKNVRRLGHGSVQETIRLLESGKK